MSCSQSPSKAEDSLYTIDDIDTVLGDDNQTSYRDLGRSQVLTSQQDGDQEPCMKMRKDGSTGGSSIMDDVSTTDGTENIVQGPKDRQPLIVYTGNSSGEHFKGGGSRGGSRIVNDDSHKDGAVSIVQDPTDQQPLIVYTENNLDENCQEDGISGGSMIVDDDSPGHGAERIDQEHLHNQQTLASYTDDNLKQQCDEDGTDGEGKKGLVDNGMRIRDLSERDQELTYRRYCDYPNRQTSPDEAEVNQQIMTNELYFGERVRDDCSSQNRHCRPPKELHSHPDDNPTINDDDKGSSNIDVDDEDENIQVDRGWAWVVLAGTFLNTMLFVGYVKSLSILFVEYLHLFEASATTTSLIMGVLSASYSISALITMHIVLERLGVRKTALLGACISTIAMATGVFAPNITFLICVHSVLTGIGHSMLMGPGLVLLGQYFNKRRGLAVSISMSSISVGAGVFPMLTRFLLDTYHIRGTMLIYTGLTMNIFVGASLYRPFNPKTLNRKRIKTINVKVGNEHTEQNPLDLKNNLIRSVQSLELKKEKLEGPQDKVISTCRVPLLEKEKGTLCESCPSLDAVSTTGNANYAPEGIPLIVEQRTSSNNPVIEDLDTRHTVSTSLNSSFVQCKDSLSHEYLAVPLNQNSQGRNRTFSNCSSKSHHEDLASSRKMLYASNPETLSVSIINLATSSENGSDYKRQTDDHHPKSGCGFIDLTLFKKPMFRLFAVCAMLGIVSNIVPNYLPAFVSDKGIGQTDAALLLLLLGTVDFFSRIAVGYFVDLKLLRPSRFIAIGLICAGTSAQLARLYNTFPLMVMFSVIHGLVGSAYQGLVPILIVDFLGKEYLGKTLGYSSMFHGMSIAITHPIIGAIKDISGTFNNTYTYLGTCAYAAALCLLIGEPLCRQRDVRKSQPDSVK